ncbi:unnamed protein product [Pylaiella littoralis]
MSDLYHQTPPSRSYLFADTMKRYQKLLGPIFMGLCAWGAVLGYCAKTGECGTPMREVVEPFPMYCLMAFGCYALAKIGLGLIAFKDCSEDAALLDKDIQDARYDLARRGFKFS